MASAAAGGFSADDLDQLSRMYDRVASSSARLINSGANVVKAFNGTAAAAAKVVTATAKITNSASGVVKAFNGTISAVSGFTRALGSLATGSSNVIKSLNGTIVATGKLVKSMRSGTAASRQYSGGLLGIGNALNMLMPGAFRFGVVAAAGFGLAAGIKHIVSAGMEIETLTMRYEALLGSATGAKQRVDELVKFAAETPLGLQEIIKADQIMQNSGMRSLKFMRLFGDVASLTGSKIDDIAIIMGRLTQTKSMREINKLINRRVLSTKDLIGKGIEFDAKGSITSGVGETFKAVVEIMQERFGGGMEKLAATAAGRIERLGDEIWMTFVKLNEALMANNAFKSMIEMAISLADTIQSYVTPEMFDPVTKAVASLMDGSFFSKDTLAVGAAAIDAFVAVASAGFTFLKDVAVESWNIIKDVALLAINSITGDTSFVDFGQSMVNVFRFIEFSAQNWQKVMSIAILTAQLNFYKFVDAAMMVSDKAELFFIQLGSEIQHIFVTEIPTYLAYGFNVVSSAVTAIFDELIAMVARAFAALVSKVNGFLQTIRSYVPGLRLVVNPDEFNEASKTIDKIAGKATDLAAKSKAAYDNTQFGGVEDRAVGKREQELIDAIAGPRDPRIGKTEAELSKAITSFGGDFKDFINGKETITDAIANKVAPKLGGGAIGEEDFPTIIERGRGGAATNSTQNAALMQGSAAAYSAIFRAQEQGSPERTQIDLMKRQLKELSKISKKEAAQFARIAGF